MSVLLAILVVMIAEVFVIVQVAHHIGVGWTILLLVVISVSGPWLVRRTGTGVWRRARARLAEGEVPGEEIIDGVLLLAAGVLLTVPGFLTGIAGVLLLFRPVRYVVRRLGAWWLGRRAVVQVWSTGRGSDGAGTVITAGSRPVEHRPPAPPGGQALPPAAGGADARPRRPDPQGDACVDGSQPDGPSSGNDRPAGQ